MILCFDRLVLNSYKLIIILLVNYFSLILCKKAVPLKSGSSETNKYHSNGADPRSKDSTISLRLPAHGDPWHYGENWPEEGFEICGQKQQSPIRLMSTSAVLNHSLHLNLMNYNKPIRLAFIENNGHTVQMGFSDNFKAQLHGTATDQNTYEFKQLHFHWGSYKGVGSEHTVDGFRGPMEVHMVHFNTKYGSLDDAVDKPDGLMVLGVLFEISSRSNQFLSSVINLVKKVPKYKDKAFMSQTFTLRSLLPTRLRPFFMYSGSLTTPPCYETVRWLVFRNQVPISIAQEKQFRKCRSDYANENTGRKRTLSNNYRPVQAINERQISYST